MLGNALLKGYYSAFDMDNKQFGFAPHQSSLKTELVAGTKPIIELTSSELPLWAIIVIAIGGAAVLAISVWLTVQYLCC